MSDREPYNEPETHRTTTEARGGTRDMPGRLLGVVFAFAALIIAWLVYAFVLS